MVISRLGLDRFWAERLPDSREGTCWRHLLQTLVCYRLIDPGSEWRLHRRWFEQSALGDLLGQDFSNTRLSNQQESANSVRHPGHLPLSRISGTCSRFRTIGKVIPGVFFSAGLL